MPYPGVNVAGTLNGPWMIQYPSGSIVKFNNATYQYVYQYHPASHSNPIQPDGTRRMSAWRHYGGRWRSPSNAKGVMSSGPYVYRYSGCFPSAPISPAHLKVWSGGRDTARLRALASWSERQVEYSAALRQAGQTARMVGDLGKGLAEELFDATRRYGGNLARHWKKLPEWYLQYLYGWKPLMDDISLITDKLVKGTDMGNTMHVVLKGRWSGKGEQTFTSHGGQWGTPFNCDTILQLEQRNTSVFKYAFPADRIPTLEPIGFFGGLWEGAPYSFVLDWVAPVGSWLNALDACALAIYFVEGSSSESVRTTGVRTIHYPYGTGGFSVTLDDFETSLIQKPWSFERVLESPWSITSRVPFRADLNLNHAAQGLSLLSQALKGLY